MTRKILLIGASIALLLCLEMAPNRVFADPVNFSGQELLGRPTDRAITLNLCADQDLQVYVEYGTQPAAYTHQTPTGAYLKSAPFNIVIGNLSPNTTYYYRVRYRPAGTADFLARNQHFFKTAKPKGAAFTFAVEADPHLDDNTDPELYKLALQNIQQANADFLIDLGDNFMSEKLVNPTQDSILVRHLLLRSFYDTVCHSLPLYLALGNHEGELGTVLDGTPNNMAVMTANTRTKYFPNPLPDDFYSGNTQSENFVGLRGNYYAWEWGDALFVVLDPYWYTTQRQGDNWKYTLGKTQYDWFKTTLESSHAKFKFVFSHQILGGKDNQGRGGSDYAQYYEMGGLNADSTWGFSTKRPGWDLPLHQLMVKNGVNVFFHGHDHFYVSQQKDGLIYQLVPQPGYPGTNSANQMANYGYFTGTILSSSGYLKVTVTDSTAKVEYIKSAWSGNGAVAHSYTIRAKNDATAVEDAAESSADFQLFQNYPNPFNPRTTIQFALPKAERVTVRIYNLAGQLMETPVDRELNAGLHSVEWDAGNAGSGIYLCHLQTGSRVIVQKMILLR